MAAAPGTETMEAELKKLLQAEVERRHQFLVKLQDLEHRWKHEEEEASVGSLMEELQRADDIVTPMLLKCQRLCLEDISRRDKDSGGQRDSGFTPSSDIGVVKRQAVFVPVTEYDGDGFPEASRLRSSIEDQPQSEGDELRRSGEPTQHTDDSSDTESSSL